MTVKPTKTSPERTEWSVYDGPVRVAVIVEEPEGTFTTLKGECDIVKATVKIEKFKAMSAPPALRGGL